MKRLLLITAAFVGLGSAAVAQPNLVLTEQGVEAIRQAEDLPPLFEGALAEAQRRLERSFEEGVVVPVPKDPGGGYTHERHKENYKIVHDAGILYQLTGEGRYLQQAERLLLAYADMYNGLPLHPEQKNQAPGRLFWQGLNEAVWLVYVIQGYDAIRDDLSPVSRERIETELLRPVAEFLSTGSRRTFQRIHNHGTWSAAAVGMTGYALDDPELVERALLGLDGDGEAGFLAQLDQLFSPDGYYTEGPYYQRYALMPFVLFGQAIEANEPERGIFERGDGVLLKAITATIQQSYAGRFFPINDAIREKGLDTQELVYGVAAAYELTGDRGLLSIADFQGAVVLTGAGLAVARDLEAGLASDFDYASQLLRDGPDGDQGGLGILRMGEGPLAQTLVAKHTGQGLGHGHFDKLALIWYDAGREILADYGAARFLNVPSKDGGRYLPENTSWAKQSIAHNTVVVGEASHFGGDWRRGQESWPTVHVFEPGERLSVVSASIADAYPDTNLQRTTFQVQAGDDRAPIVIDIVDVVAPAATAIDLPFYFNGQLTDSSVAIERPATSLLAMGADHGYQHLWVEGEAQTAARRARFTWLAENRFYSYHSLVSEDADIRLVRTGANDPQFNLRSEQGIIMRLGDAASARFISIFEPHGIYDPAQEFTVASEPDIQTIETASSDGASLIKLTFLDGSSFVLGVANDPTSTARHHINHEGRSYRWRGFHKAFWE